MRKQPWRVEGHPSPDPERAWSLWEQLQEAPTGMWLDDFMAYSPLTTLSFPDKDPVLEFHMDSLLGSGHCQSSDLCADIL